jgi:hypothetical protein
MELIDPSSMPMEPVMVKPLLDFNMFFTDFTKAKNSIDAMVKPVVEASRNRRKNLVDVKKLRDEKMLDGDETYIPVRVIDENVNKEIIPFIKYLITSGRVGIFKDTENDQAQHEILESDYSRVFRYENWVAAPYQAIYSGILHGMGAVEINVDLSKPGRFSFYYVSKEDLIFPDSIRLEAAPFVGIRLKLSCIELEAFMNLSGFNNPMIQRQLDDGKDNKDKRYIVYKVYTKLKGVVHVAFILEGDDTGWLRDPQPFNNGVYDKKVTQPTQTIDPFTGQLIVTPPEIQWIPTMEQQYPIFPWLYKWTDEESIAKTDGRGVLDESKQEAQSTLVTSFVNAANRASTSYFSVEKDTDSITDLALLDFKLQRGRVANRPLKSFTAQFPPMDLMRAVNQLDVRGKAEIGQTAWAVDNRVDSRKTAAEIELSSSKEQELDSVTVLLFSIWWSSVLNYTWRIIKSASLRGDIRVGHVKTENPDGTVTYTPDEALLSRTFIILPSGDVDVIQKAQELDKRMRAWPLVQGVPVLATAFLVDILKLMFPRDAMRYEQILTSAQAQSSLGPVLLEMLKGLLSMPQNAQMAQEYGPQIMQIEQSMAGAATK